MWATAGVKTNPQAGDILADTGALGLGTFGFTVLLWTDSGIEATIHHRNAANNGDIASQVINPGANNPYSVGLGLALALNERLTVTCDNNVSGHAQVSILN